MYGISNAVTQERNYSAAEELFQDLVAANKYITTPTLPSFQKSIAKLVRFSPTPNKLMHYSNMLLSDFGPPLRDDKIENTILIDILKRCSRWRGDYLASRLDFVKIGMERGLSEPNNLFPAGRCIRKCMHAHPTTSWLAFRKRRLVT